MRRGKPPARDLRMERMRSRLWDLVASGLSGTDRVWEVQQLGAGPYIRKHYTLEKIGLAVRTALDN